MKDIVWQAINFKDRAINSLRQRGIIASLRLGVKALFSIIWLEKRVFKFDLIAKNMYRLPKPLLGVEFREARPEDFPELLRFSQHFSKKEMLGRFTYGHKCFIARADNRIIFYTWLGINQADVPMLGKKLTIPANTAYFYNSFTDVSYRHRKILPGFISTLREFCAENEFPLGLSLVDAEIGLPIKSYSKLTGTEKITLCVYRRRFGFKTYSMQRISSDDAAVISRKYRSRYKSV